jgi:LysM repeat protein
MHLRTMTLLSVAAALLLPATAQADYGHVVLPGETLSSIAASDGLSEPALAAANGLSPDAGVIVGQTIEIPPQTSANAAAASTTDTASASASTSQTATATAAGGGSYVVQPGDTLSAIASRAGTTVAQLAALNGLDPNSFLLAGTALQLPGASEAATATPATETGTGSGGPYPTEQYLSGSEVGNIAAANGLSPALAEAIGWQESGYNNAEVSPTGAVGVMQIEPSTWSWIQTHLSGGALAPASAADNVRGGVLLLKDLVSLTGSDALAAAGYYQGIASVEQHGMYPSTQQYVNDVLALEHRLGG